MGDKQIAMIVSLYHGDELQAVKEMFTSLFDQTFQQFSIYVQKDGPLQKSVDDYLEWLLSNDKITYLGSRDINKGLAYSLNELIGRALTDGHTYLCRMDGDDLCDPQRLALQYAYMKNHPEIDALGGWIEEFNTDTGERQTVCYPEGHREIVQHLAKRNPMAHVTVMFRNTFFQKAGRYNTDFVNEDYELWIRGINDGVKLHNLQETLVHVRTNNAFFNRRRNIKRAWEVMFLKFKATRLYGFGLKGYCYAIAHFFLFLSPDFIKRFAYKYLR